MDRRQWMAIVCGSSLTACSRGGPNQANLPRIAADAGIQLPPSSQLMFEQEGLADKSGLWILRAEERFDLPGDKEPTESDTGRLELDKHLKPGVTGELADGIATNHSWRKDDLRYRGMLIRSSNGYFLRLRNFA